MASVPDRDSPPRPRPCPHCGGRAFQTFGHGADTTRYCMTPACGRPFAGPTLPPLPADHPARCPVCRCRPATHTVPGAWGAAGRCDTCFAAYRELERRQRSRAGAPLALRVVPADVAGRATPAPPRSHRASVPRPTISEAAFAHTAPGVYCAYVAVHDGKPPTIAQLASRLSEHFAVHPTVQVRIIERCIQRYRQQGGIWPPDCLR